ncbi:dTMP kinase [Paucibacter sp. DJ1R-11]|uniref:dTMP kinase n=1 Tax=Paucibacter sp. DJ1R-11 TaxID=2893556 RepID=UPI0021E4DCE0|nr:dTMP kinase [Paucibacter sp. DJ1R-11]MCV2364389.1 dTMP kinase [Paucibacter sp. DJ1R-11]
MNPAHSSSARFISFEGIDGAGKSTHIEALGERLRQRGAELVHTREPGGTELAESLRELILHRGMDSLTEALLVFAGRRDHLQRVIEPALAAGKTVLCDRFTDASFAYQGGGRGMDLTVLETLEQWVQGGRQPDLTFWFDLDPAIAAQRRAAAREADRFEQQDLDFFTRVRTGYATRAASAPQRFARIDASLSVAEVAAQIHAVLEARGW